MPSAFFWKKESLAKKTDMGPGAFTLNFHSAPCDIKKKKALQKNLPLSFRKKKVRKENQYGAWRVYIKLTLCARDIKKKKIRKENQYGTNLHAM